MNGLIYFWIAFVALLLVIFYCDRKYSLLRDISIADKKPYSFSRVQLAWWTTIVLAAFISIVVSHNGIPTFDTSTLILLGISSATTATARTIDISDQKNQKVTRSQDKDGQWFLLDILSDAEGVSIHRLQAVIFNLTIGLWFIAAVTNNLVHFASNIDNIIPQVTQNNLILLGLSSGTYAALKATENKTNQSPSPTAKQDVQENADGDEKA